MIAAKIRIQVIAFLVISVLGITYVGLRYVGLGGALLNDTYVVNADFSDSGGIFTGAEVTYRGVTVGKVGAMHLRPDGVRIQLRINGNTKVPVDTSAVVADRSAVGEQYIDLRPASARGPYLRPNGLIPRGHNSTPLPVQTLLLNLDRLVNSVDRNDLATVIDELGKAFANAGPDLQRLLDNGDALLSEADANLGQTLTLVRDGKTVLDSQRASSDDIKRWAAGLATLSAQLRSSDPDIRRLLADGPGAASELTGLLAAVRPTIGVLLSNLIVVGQVQGRRINGLQQILVTYPVVTTGGFTVVRYDPTTKQWTSHFGLELSPDPASCQRAYPKRHSVTSPPPPGHCTNGEMAAGSGVRSDRNAPRPGGPEPAPTVASSAGTSAQSAPSVTDGYDPIGRAIVPGSTGGQQGLLGDQSWQWLLLGPLSR